MTAALVSGGGVRVVDGELAPVALELGRMHGMVRARVAECLVASGGGEVVGVEGQDDNGGGGYGCSGERLRR